LKHAIAQVIEAETIGDKVLVSAHSNELAKKFGWLTNSGNIPSAYLTGLLCGFKAKANGLEKAYLDIGLHIPSKGTRVFAAMKGFVDAGIDVPHSEAILPSESRICGKHIADYGSYLSSEPELYKQKFSKYLSKGSRPEDISNQFSRVKDKIRASFEKKVKEQKE
jgi:large subunit ribosomal protein L18